MSQKVARGGTEVSETAVGSETGAEIGGNIVESTRATIEGDSTELTHESASGGVPEIGEDDRNLETVAKYKDSDQRSFN